MGVWERYEARLKINGTTRREAVKNRTTERLSQKLLSTLSYNEVTINGELCDVAITDQEDFDIKNIYSMPGGNLYHGGLVEWDGDMWLITDIDAHDEIYTKGIMKRCNYILRWINDEGHIIERWCIVEDGTKYLIGEKTNQFMSIGDARIAVTIGKDEDTNHIKRGMRFVIDDLDVQEPLVYQLTKPNRLFSIYNGRGVFRYIMNEVNATDNDNLELRIADYYSWKPKKERYESDVHVDEPFEEIRKKAIEDEEKRPEVTEERKVWI